MNFSEEENIFFAKLVERFGLLTKPERSSLWKMNVTEFNTTTGKNVDSKLIGTHTTLDQSECGCSKNEAGNNSIAQAIYPSTFIHQSTSVIAWQN